MLLVLDDAISTAVLAGRRANAEIFGVIDLTSKTETRISSISLGRAIQFVDNASVLDYDVRGALQKPVDTKPADIFRQTACMLLSQDGPPNHGLGFRDHTRSAAGILATLHMLRQKVRRADASPQFKVAQPMLSRGPLGCLLWNQKVSR